ADAHSRLVRIAKRCGHLAAQSHGVVEAGEYGKDREQVTVLDWPLQPVVVERELVDAARLSIIDALYRRSLDLRGGRQASGHVEQLAHVASALQLEDGGAVDASRYRGELPDGREEDDIARQQGHVLRLIAGEKQVVHIKGRDHARTAAQLN